MGEEVEDLGSRTGRMLRQDDSVFNEADHWSLLTSVFQEMKTVELTNIIEIKSIYGISELRDVTTSTGSGSVSHTGDEFKLSTSGSTGDRAVFETAETGRYVPGYGAEAGIGIRTASTELPGAGQEERWGYFDDNDGAYFGRSSTGLFVEVVRGTSRTRIGRSDWNGDQLDGSGDESNPSARELKTDRGHIYQIDFSWYGYGTLEFKAMVASTRGRQEPVTLHRHEPDGRTSIRNPNLPVRAELTRGGSTAHELFVSGRKFALQGPYIPNRRRTSDRRTSRTGLESTGDFVPLVSFRRKASSTGAAQFQETSVKVGQLDVIADTDMYWQIRANGTLSSSAWATPSDHTAAETAVEAETSSTGISGGQIIDQGLISGGSKNNTQNFTEGDPLDFDFIRREPVSLCVRPTTGSGAVTSCVFDVREEW